MGEYKRNCFIEIRLRFVVSAGDTLNRNSHDGTRLVLIWSLSETCRLPILGAKARRISRVVFLVWCPASTPSFYPFRKRKIPISFYVLHDEHFTRPLKNKCIKTNSLAQLDELAGYRKQACASVSTGCIVLVLQVVGQQRVFARSGNKHSFTWHRPWF